MPEATIQNIAAQKFSPVLYELATQKESKFASKVRRESVANAELAYFDTYGVEDLPEQAVIRHGDTPLSESPFGRRKVTPVRWDKGTLLDDYDLQRLAADPKGAVAQGFAKAFGKKKDDIIITAAFADAAVGKTGASTVAFKDESIGINGTTGGVATSLGTLAAASTPVGLELAKILRMLQIFNEADVDESEQKYWAVTPKDISYMLDLTEVGSADYNTVKAIAAGKVDSYAGFNFFWTNRLPKDAATSTAYRTFAFTPSAIVLAYIADLTSSIDKRVDKKNSWQLYSYMDLGAVRMEGAKVHECLTVV